ncbi:MAG: sugar-binding domain-containing protein, partial [Gemmatimonadota bacterium]
MRRIDLQGDWELVERPLTDGPEAAAAVRAAPATLAAAVPGDVNDSLVRAGRLSEPLVGLNFRAFGWVRERSWWYRRRFPVPAGWADAWEVELALDGLDVHGDIWVNGAPVGHQASAFYPFVRDVKPHLRWGEANEVLVRLTTGQERVPADPGFPLMAVVPTEGGRGYPDRGFPGRIYLRKPAYVWGWDWNPPLATCGITGAAELRCREPVEVGDVYLATALEGDGARVRAEVEVCYHTEIASGWGAVEVTLTDEAGASFAARREGLFVASGRNRVDLEIAIPQARLWWPNGSGPPHRYAVGVRAEVDGQVAARGPFPYGARTVELEVRPGRFAFRVNGQPLFIQGGNWVPPDSLYGRITDAKVTRLVEEAAAAHFNCLRIWGGGRFELDAFYEACERTGVMVWHDFMAACSPLPAHEEWFRREFRAEAEYQLRRLRSRACMLLWSGNNEVSQVYAHPAFRQQRDPGWDLYHRDLPQLVRQLCPGVPYWPTSPYGGTDSVHHPTTGDSHHWVVMRPEPEYWSSPEYWDSPERPIFNSEYGYGGPCCLESTRQYLGTEAPDLFDETGRQHTNTFYDIPRVNHSIGQHYRDPAGIELADYILLGGLCQGLNLGHSLESLRANEQTMGGIHWMYDDAWGENGWTLIDYYLRRKVSYYHVARCLAPQRLVLRPGGRAFGGREGEVVLIGLNSGPEPRRGRLELGYLSWDGGRRELAERAYEVPPRSKALLATVPAPREEDLRRGTVVAWPLAEEVVDRGSGGGRQPRRGQAPGESVAARFEPVWWRHRGYREMGWPATRPELVAVRPDGGDL